MTRPAGEGTARRAPPTIVFHGSRDGTVHRRNGEQVIAQAKAAEATLSVSLHDGEAAGGRRYTRTRYADAGGQVVAEHWLIHGAGHAWSGGSPSGSYTDPTGPDASREMLRFFLSHPGGAAG